MKLVIQEDDWGCGIACLAMVANVTYTEAREHLIGNREVAAAMISAKLKNGLEFFGVQHSGSFKSLGSRNYKDLPSHAIVQWLPTKKRPHENWYHWTVWDAERKVNLDPAPELASEVAIYPSSFLLVRPRRR